MMHGIKSQLRILSVFTLFLLSFSLSAIDITVTNVQENTATCGNVQINIDVSNAVLDDPIPNFPFTGDFVNLIIRDGNCNIIGWSFFTLVDGPDVLEIPLDFPCINGLYCPPTARPLTYSFHDSGNQVGVELLETVPPVTSFVYDPLVNCSNLPLVADPNCSFAAAPIPTLGTWGIISLSLLLLIVGSIYLQSINTIRQTIF